MATARIGRVVRNLTLATTDGDIELKSLRGDNVVLYFYPKDSTPGCTTEGREFAELHTRFRRARTRIFGVSRDSLKSHEKFRDKQGFPFHLVSDPDEIACRYFDVIHEKSLYGRRFMGIVRSTFLIDADGKLRKDWRKVTVKGHAAEVLDAVRLLNRKEP